MRKQDADRLIEGYVRKLYGFAVSKLGNIDEAEELAGEIVLTVYKTLLDREEIVNVDGYVYKIAHNVWVRYLDRKHRYVSVDGIEYLPDERDYAAALADDEMAGIIRREITYLSEMQRKVVVLHYFHDQKVRQIADALSLSPNTVKWHLACSRKELSEGMEKTRVTGNLGVQPIRLVNMGHNGHPGSKGDTQDFLAKSLSQNIVYAAYHTPKTINEIAEELGVNPIFVKDEVDVLCREYAEQIAQVQLKVQPAHMHALVRYYAQNQACALHTRIMKKLLDMGALKPPTPDQAKGLCTVLFLV